MSDDLWEWYNKWMRIHQNTSSYLTISLGSVGFLLNAITLVALCLVKRQALGPHLLLLRSLTAADMMTALQLTLEKLPLDRIIPWCVRNALFRPCSPFYTITYVALILIAANLYIAVVHPLRHNELVKTEGQLWLLSCVGCLDLLSTALTCLRH